MKKALLLSLPVALGFLAGCAPENPTPQSQDHVSTIPWNKPEKWEGTGVLGGIAPNSQ